MDWFLYDNGLRQERVKSWSISFPIVSIKLKPGEVKTVDDQHQYNMLYFEIKDYFIFFILW